jgi:general secretion pathway protein N
MTLRLVLLVLASSVLYANAETSSTAPSVDSLDGQFNRSAVPNVSPGAEQRPVPAPAGHHPAGNPLWAIPLKVLSATRERPIFSPSRRPPPMIASPLAVPASVTASKPTEPQRPQLLLVGTVVGEKEAIAVFVDETTKNPIRLRTGEGHQGWVLQSVHGREATFEKDQQTATLSLPQPGSDKSPASPPQAVFSPPQAVSANPPPAVSAIPPPGISAGPPPRSRRRDR